MANSIRSDSIRIDTGVKRILVNDDPNRVITFNPKDIVFAEKFYNLIKKFEDRQSEFEGKATELDAQDEKDEFGLPLNTKERLELLKEICQFMRAQIDDVFGEGTSQAAFGDAISLDMFGQFFDGISPFIKHARSEKVQIYRKVVADRKKIEDEKAVMD
jgi:DNA-binding XRE family transcriptional regulator